MCNALRLAPICKKIGDSLFRSIAQYFVKYSYSIVKETIFITLVISFKLTSTQTVFSKNNNKDSK